MGRRLPVGVITLAAGLQCLTAGQVFFTDFEAGTVPSQITGAGSVVGTQGYSAYSTFQTKFLQNASTGNPATATTLTITGLAAHTTLSLNFLLAIIDSWDGCCGPDVFNVQLDGNSLFAETFSNFGGSQSYAGSYIASANNLGFSGWNDSAIQVGLNSVAHTASTATIQFFASGAGWQGGTDESWAIDDVSVSINSTPGVPEPASWVLVAGGGLLALGWKRRRG